MADIIEESEPKENERMESDMKKCLYPQPDAARAEWLNLNGTWAFSFDTPVFDRTIEVPYPWGSPLSGISESRDGIGWYRRTVRWNPDNSRIFLCFGAVDFLCEVKVNGTEVGQHRGGYARFEFEVTDIWNRDGENEILVRAEDMGGSRNKTHGKQYYGDARGIWQTVWLEVRPDAFIRAFSVNTKISGCISYEIETDNAPDGMKVAASFAGNRAEGVTENNHASVSFTVEAPHLWTPDDPYLYEGTLTLEGKAADTVETYFGIREIGTGKFGEKGRNYITLNGKPIYLNGVLDQSFNPQGYFTLPSDEDCRDEILRLKRIGINMARIHIKAEEPLKLYYADKYGMLIMEDIPCFWGEATPDVREQYEEEMEAEILRDRNHPSVFYWVLFNETWGLFTSSKDANGNPTSVYSAETAEWVVSCYKKAKALDPTRIIEDNSWGHHTETDVNTWHFYCNGYKHVKEGIEGFCAGAYPGSAANYHEGYLMKDVPVMNSECGSYWSVIGGAGMSDISWQYKYMMNEFRLHDKLFGFVFTEFHDVVNEFNGYYKIDNSDKDFGYSAYGMSICDLHAQDYLGADFAPMTTVHPGDEITLPMVASSFSDQYTGKTLDVVWELSVIDPADGETAVSADNGFYSVIWGGYGCTPAGAIRTVIPDADGTAVLSWTLYDGEKSIMRNCVFFDIDAPRTDVLSIEPAVFTPEGFSRVIPAISGAKVSGIGSGSFSCTVKTADIPDFADARDLHVIFEASTRAPMSHDDPDCKNNIKKDTDYMHGYCCDPGENPNAFPQTDDETNPGTVCVKIDGIPCGTFYLPDCPADSRGLLSHHYQPEDNHLDEAGSYGYLCRLTVPSALLLRLKEKESFCLTLETESGNGLSLFGRKSGRFGCAVILSAEADDR